MTDNESGADLVERFEARFAAQEARFAAQDARIAALEAENAALRATTQASWRDADDSGHRIGRRALMIGAAGAAATAATLTSATPAAAASGDPLILGAHQDAGNFQTSVTVKSHQYAGFLLTNTGEHDGLRVVTHGGDGIVVQAGGPGNPIGVLSRSVLGTGVYGETGTLLGSGVVGKTERSGFGVFGEARLGTAGTGTGVLGAGKIGVAADGDLTGVVVVSDDVGVSVSATGAHLVLDDPGSPARVAPIAETREYRIRSVVADETGAFWVCIAGGSPGTWRKLAGPGTAGALHLLPTPARVYDSRPGTLPSQGPKTLLPAGIPRAIDLKVNNSSVPAGATGALVTVLLVNATAANGNFTIWANDKPKPLSNTMVWGGSAGRFTTLAMTALDAQARVKIDASHPTNVVLDVVGYYR